MWILILITMVDGEFNDAKAFGQFEDRKSCEASLVFEASQLGIPDLSMEPVWLLNDGGNLTADIYTAAPQHMPDGRTFRKMSCITVRPRGG